MRLAHKVYSLDFHLVDDLLFASSRGNLPGHDGMGLSLDALGPLIELMHAASERSPLSSLLNSVCRDGPLKQFSEAYLGGQRQWMCTTKKSGFLRLRANQGETAPSRFCIEIHRAALAAGFASSGVRQLVGALLEMHGNILEHSGAIETGVLAFRVSDGLLEFAVADCGAGILSTLIRNPVYAHITTHAVALRLALTNGVSRFPDSPDRGQGFRPLFLGLAGMNGNLRFRSGDHALTLAGRNLMLENHQTLQREYTSGFLASVASRIQ